MCEGITRDQAIRMREELLFSLHEDLLAELDLIFQRWEEEAVSMHGQND